MPLRDADRENITARLSRIEGQVRGLKRMVDDDRYCGDILDQIQTCVTDAIRSGDESAAQESYDEIMGLLEKEL
jgi:DNA-binding FrmR family transcriptional regulator